MTKTIISIVIVALLAVAGWKGWQVWEKYSHDQDLAQQEATALKNIVPEQLQGMPSGWEEGYQKAYQAAQNGDIATLRNWLKMRGQQVDDPRRAWIEMDYMVIISKQDPQEAKAIFDSVKGRVPQDSPVYARVKQLEKTYE
jgi:thioredoxin-like negative regulator of GroEL